MSVEYKKNIAVFKDVVSVEEAETLLEWLQKKRVAKIDLFSCTHLHAANLQVLMVAKPMIINWPSNPDFASWLRTALSCKIN